LRLWKIIVKSGTVVKFGVDDGGCFEVELRTDATKLMNVIIA